MFSQAVLMVPELLKNTLVLDIGHTHVKVCLVDENGSIIERFETANKSQLAYNTLIFNCDKIWAWFLQILGDICTHYSPAAISVTCHGAAMALLDDAGELLFVMDYESDVYEAVSGQYNLNRGLFTQTGSPNLANGLNLGRQLFWLQTMHADVFSRVHTMLPYPQYWSYKLSGCASTEVSSLGTHTDLWNAHKHDYSELVDERGWRRYFPPLKDAWDSLGPPLEAICKQTGLSRECRILCGIHDSNASYAYHFTPGKALSVLSTGTWVIGLCSATTATLLEHNDELLNVNLLGNPLPSFRFMGGQEWSVLSESIRGTPSLSLVGKLISKQVFALPAFSNQGGPFRRSEGRIVGQLGGKLEQKALASLYCAQTTAWSLARFAIEGTVIVDGPFIRDEIYLQALANLLPNCQFFVSANTDGTALGAARLARWPKALPHDYTPVIGRRITGLQSYHNTWLEMVALGNNRPG